jgi:AcrR family transcriptional regulator
VADKDELVREVLARLARARARQLAPGLAQFRDPGERIAEGVYRTVEAVRNEWWYKALARHGATAAVARMGGGPQAFVALVAPLVAPSIERLAAAGMLRPGVTVEDATEWLCIVATGLLATAPDAPPSTAGGGAAAPAAAGSARSRADQIAFLRRFVADPLLRRE